MRSCKKQGNISQPDLEAIKSWLLAQCGQVRFLSYHHHHQGLPEAPSSEGQTRRSHCPWSSRHRWDKSLYPPGQEGSCRRDQEEPTQQWQHELNTGKGWHWHLQKLELLASRKEAEQEHPSKAASEGGKGKCSTLGVILHWKLRWKGTRSPRRALWWVLSMKMLWSQQSKEIW